MLNKNFDFSVLKEQGIIDSIIPLHNFYEISENPIQPWCDNDVDNYETPAENPGLFNKQ